MYLRNLTFWTDPWNGNRPPQANAGFDQVISADANGVATVSLDGSATVDLDGDALQLWWMTDGELLATGERPTVPLPIGSHLIQLVVRDPADHVSTDELLIVVTGEFSFLRGDSNTDGTVDISDAINTLGYLFTGNGKVTCADAADANDSGTIDISDPIFTLGFLFLGTRESLPAPSPTAGMDPTPDGLSCQGT